MMCAEKASDFTSYQNELLSTPSGKKNRQNASHGMMKLPLFQYPTHQFCGFIENVVISVGIIIVSFLFFPLVELANRYIQTLGYFMYSWGFGFTLKLRCFSKYLQHLQCQKLISIKTGKVSIKIIHSTNYPWSF